MIGTQNNNAQGQRAEEIFGVRITQDYLFRARDLGAKWPVSDYYVEINDDNNPLYFIVQIKSTIRSLSSKNKLPISVSKRKLNQFSNYNAPTFLAGVNIQNETVYMIPIYRRQPVTLYSIPTTFVLSANNKTLSFSNLKLLEKEVRSFWWQTYSRTDKRNFKSLI